MESRIERDSMGQVAVPKEALYGAQTQRAVDNFPISGTPMPKAFIQSLLQIKAAAARANAHLGVLAPDCAHAIAEAALSLARNDRLMQHFPVDVFQTGSGTSSNMNANEVLASLAAIGLGRPVSANDEVNQSQSSNDVIPSCIHVSAAKALATELLPALEQLKSSIRTKAAGLSGSIKTGRTHLMDAMPVRLSQSLETWASQLDAQALQLQYHLQAVQHLPQGGTAVGTGVNAPPGFSRTFCDELNLITGLGVQPAANLFTYIASQDAAVALSGQLKSLAVTLMKIANDLRWMNSGPLSGLGEIRLPALQPGSSIMPGKVNPVIPEAVAMVAAQVIGNDACITVAGQSGNFELNVMLPVIAHNLLSSLQLLSKAMVTLADKAIAGFEVCDDRLARDLARNPILVTALNPVIGYAKAAEIAKRAYAEGRPILEVAAEMTDMEKEELVRLLDPARLTGQE
ncbi:class II fumarate hydratase [Shewanella cyperi]|uniref:Fumarate hydratase class II n=1 Tax=Shewanella cyperi TaxID=2814292 RepID=A0A975AKW0_9GAMM|nr:class II fumarate hydratase [Shewanella cyperi]QSX30777.1 class II fumarate hydratase [Shewanella cyperi]